MDISTKTLSGGLKSIAGLLEKEKFDITILSTCLGGTPVTANDFLQSTRYLIASPEDLHLSYMNIDYLKKLNSLEKFNPFGFSKSFAENSFEELKNNTNTIISIAVYDLEKLNGRLSSLMNKNISCGEAADFLSNIEGVEIYFRAPKFGKRQNETEHSGWNCAEKE